MLQVAFPADIWQMTSDLNWLLQISCSLEFNSFKTRKTSFRLLREFSFDFTWFIYNFFNGFGSWPKSPWLPWLFCIWKGTHTAQIPALDSPHTGDEQKPKEKKGKLASTSTYPLEVRLIFSIPCEQRLSEIDPVTTMTRIFRSPYKNIWQA